MKKLTLFFVLTFIIQATALSQPCLPEGITFTTQEQIDNFQTNYPGCTEIIGDVEINGDDITNLNGLNVLTAFWGKLHIGNYPSGTSLTSLSGLDNVTFIGGNLSVEDNAALTSLTGLNNVTSIGGYICIAENAALTNLTGLDTLTSIRGSIYIRYNNALTSLTGLENMTSLGGLT